MKRRRPVMILSAVLAVALATGVRAGLFSKTYVFKADTTLEIGEEIEPGVRLDTVRIALPSSLGGRVFRTGGLVRADVEVSNTGSESTKVGVAMALLDEEDRLLGVASGGTRLWPIKPGRQVSYTLIFEDVNAEAYKATRFHISVEPKR